MFPCNVGTKAEADASYSLESANERKNVSANADNRCVGGVKLETIPEPLVTRKLEMQPLKLLAPATREPIVSGVDERWLKESVADPTIVPFKKIRVVPPLRDTATCVHPVVGTLFAVICIRSAP